MPYEKFPRKTSIASLIVMSFTTAVPMTDAATAMAAIAIRQSFQLPKFFAVLQLRKDS